MSVHTTPSDELKLARLEMRRTARRIVQNHQDVSAHLARLHAALALPGAEPAQGVLADLFMAFGTTQSVMKRGALELARARLATHVVRWFESQVMSPALAPITALATRWSVLATASADISTRARRCSVDDSRLLAAQAMADMAANRQEALQAFLHHCITCHDNLAFMLARRAMLAQSPELPEDWNLTSQQLEQSMEQA